MALIKHANSHNVARDAIVLDLGDLSRQGQILIESARARADQLLAEGKAERDRIVAGAAERGHAEGLAKGLEDGRRKGEQEGKAAAAAQRAAQIEQIEKSWTAALAQFNAQREAMLCEAHVDVLRLATLIAGKVVKRIVEADPTVVVDQMRAVLGAVTRPTELTIRVNPADLQVATESLPGLVGAFEAVQGASIEPDATLAPGSCVATTRGTADVPGGGEINASIDAQLERIIEVLLPGADAGTGEAGRA